MRLSEVTRKDLLNKTKSEHPERYARRMKYVNSIKPLPVAKQLFMDTGTLTIPIKIGDYIVTIHISGILKEIQNEMNRQNKSLPDRSLTYAALRKVVDSSNIYINCTCADFRYRFSYSATQNDYKYGAPETRPAKITNPNNDGAVCKHVTAALVRPSQWLKYAAGWINTVVRAYIINRSGIAPLDAVEELEKEKNIKGPEEINPESENDAQEKDLPEEDVSNEDSQEVGDLDSELEVSEEELD